ncbi:MAG: hypothetical protein WC340_09825 [Kiritimatiellia bacterium]
MSETIPTIRIFISSPGDVAVERGKARKVVEALQKRYAGRLKLETMLWEDLPLGAETSFQQGIDLVLSDQHGVDIAVFILWSRLGSPLGAAIRKPDGTEYRSGTEREFDMMLSARALLDAVPELRVDDETLAELREVLAGGLDKALKMLLKRVFPDAGKAGTMRLVLLLDQFEELFTASGASDEEIRCFLRAIQSLACSGFVWVLATVRSDFYDRCQRFPILIEMKGSQGQIDLLPPEPSDIHRIITGPAVMAGLAFEKSETGETLDQRILNDVVGHPEALPLLEFMLSNLFDHRSADNVLTLAQYEKLGGIDGAIGHHAEKVYASLSDASRIALVNVIPLLAQCNQANGGEFVRRKCDESEYENIDGASEAVQAMVNARLMVKEFGHEGHSVIYVSHEAVFRTWERASQAVGEARSKIELRTYLSNEAQRWEHLGKSKNLLLPRKRFAYVDKLIQNSATPLSDTLLQYIWSSECVERRAGLFRTFVFWLIVQLSIDFACIGTVDRLSKNFAKEAVKLFAGDSRSDHSAELKLAHALLLDGQYEDAVSLHDKYMYIEFPDGELWRKKVYKDFQILRAAGRDHPDMKKIEAMLEDAKAVP